MLAAEINLADVPGGASDAFFSRARTRRKSPIKGV